MKMKNKIITLFLMVFLLFGVASCGSPTGEVSFTNYENIITVTAATTDGTTASTYNDVIVYLGSATDYTNYDAVSGDGYLEWTGTDGIYVKVTFENFNVTEKEQTGVYQSIYTTPIGVKGNFWDWILTQLGYFTLYASNLFGLLGDTYLYWLGLLLMTLAIRTLGWPIYAKTNDMSLKMQLAQPELTKVQEKYRNRSDQASQQRMQMETMDIYKKYKINLLGCFMPLLQMPIFIAMYQVVQRFPLTDLSYFSSDPIVMNQNFLWTTLGNTNMAANIPLAIIVAVLMLLSQWLSQHRAKSQQTPNQYQSAKQQQSANSMKYMMYFMALMMGYFSLRSAGIAFYWIIGTSYQLFQSYISYRNMNKRQDKLRKQF